MKNKNSLFLLMVCLTTLICNCRKGKLENTPVPVEPNCLISKISFPGFGTDFHYEYDSLDRITKYSDISMSYIPGKVFISASYSTGEIILNIQGNAISRTSKQILVLQEDISTTTINSSYVYNKEGYLIKEIITTIISNSNDSKTIAEEYNYEYENGNMKTCTLEKDGVKTIWKYTYTDMPNQLAEFEQKIDFKGKRSKNLVNTIEEIKNGSQPIVSTYLYKVDLKDRLVGESMNNEKQHSSRAFTWNCK